MKNAKFFLALSGLVAAMSIKINCSFVVILLSLGTSSTYATRQELMKVSSPNTINRLPSLQQLTQNPTPHRREDLLLTLQPKKHTQTSFGSCFHRSFLLGALFILKTLLKDFLPNKNILFFDEKKVWGRCSGSF